MKRLLLIAASVSLLGLSGAALAGSSHHHDDDGRLHSKWDHSDHRHSPVEHNRHDHDRGHYDRDHYDHHRGHGRVVYVTPRDRYRPDVYFGVILGPHGAFQYIQRW